MRSDQSGRAQLAYLGHDVNDAAVRRRVAMLMQEGVEVRLGGFRREDEAGPGSVAVALDLGRTHDARLGARVLAVVRLLLSPGRVRRFSAGAAVVVARNLEMLVLACRVRAPHQRLVYECLDIHRLMLGSGLKSRLLRWVERRLLARTDLVIVSSPAFVREYFGQRQGRGQGVLLVENKVPGERARDDVGLRPAIAGPIVIGWFGMLRCRRTLHELAAIAAQSQGRIEVVIAGKASRAEFPDFAAQVAACPGLRYLGPYVPDDLPMLYIQADYVWAIDYFEEGLNSDWLLPNRLYEGLAHGAVPIALRRVEAGRWLARHGVGLLLDDPVAELVPRLASISSRDHIAMLDAIAAMPRQALYQTSAEKRAIVAAITGGASG